MIPTRNYSQPSPQTSTSGSFVQPRNYGGVPTLPPPNMINPQASMMMSPSASFVIPASSSSPAMSSSSASPVQQMNAVTINLSGSHQPREKIKLIENRKDRELYDNLAELYSIIVTVERLEKAYVRDSVPAEAYEKACSMLISKFKTLQGMLSTQIKSVEDFMHEYSLHCPAAAYRLLKIGVPATVEHGKGGSTAGEAKLVAETTQHFITAMDNLKLGLTSVDQIQPLIADLVDSLNRVGLRDFEQKQKLKEWLISLNQMRATDELDEKQVRQLSFDLEGAYNMFHKMLADHKK